MQEATEATEEQEPQRAPKRNDVYTCPKCGNSITMHIPVSYAPVCHNQQGNHTATAVDMVLTSKKVKAKRAE